MCFLIFFSDIFYKSSLVKVSRQQSLQKLGQLQQSIANWDRDRDRDIASNSSELVYGKHFYTGINKYFNVSLKNFDFSGTDSKNFKRFPLIVKLPQIN